MAQAAARTHVDPVRPRPLPLPEVRPTALTLARAHLGRSGRERDEAIALAGRLGDASLARPLARLVAQGTPETLASLDPEVEREAAASLLAARALLPMGWRPDPRRVDAGLRSDAPGTAAAAAALARALAERGDERALERLLATRPFPAARLAVTRELARLGGHVACDALRPTLALPGEPGLRAAALLLSEEDEPEALVALAMRLRSASWREALAAGRALADASPDGRWLAAALPGARGFQRRTGGWRPFTILAALLAAAEHPLAEPAAAARLLEAEDDEARCLGAYAAWSEGRRATAEAAMRALLRPLGTGRVHALRALCELDARGDPRALELAAAVVGWGDPALCRALGNAGNAANAGLLASWAARGSGLGALTAASAALDVGGALPSPGRAPLPVDRFD